MQFLKQGNILQRVKKYFSYSVQADPSERENSEKERVKGEESSMTLESINKC